MSKRWPRCFAAALLPLLLAIAGCGDDSSNQPIGSGPGPVNPNRLPPGKYTQGALSIPSSLNDQIYLMSAPWAPGNSPLSYLWGFTDLNGFSLFPNLTLPSKEIVVAVIDTGIDKDHEDLVGRLWVNPGEGSDDHYQNGVDDDGNGYVDDFIGWDFVDNTNNPADDAGHGTHVSGTIGAIGGNGNGIVGIAPWVRIMPLKVCDSSGSCDSSDIRAAIHYAVQKGAKVINISLGAFNQGADSDAFNQAITDATKAGVLIFVAAGNSDTDVIQMTPANATYAVAVAASRSDGNICSFSNFGWKIDLAAPGCGYDGTNEISGVVSANSHKCGPSGTDACSTAHLVVGDKYTGKMGTSMATPHAVGMAALALTASPTATPLQIRQALLRTARAEKAGYWSRNSGAGRVYANNLIQEAQTAPGIKITSPRYGTKGSGLTVGFRVEARAAPVTWTLRYQSEPTASTVDLTAGTTIASSATDVAANASVDLTQSWTPPAAGNYLVVLEATANGQKYYDLTLLGL